MMVKNERFSAPSPILGAAALFLLACSGDGNDDKGSRQIVAKLRSCDLVEGSGRFSDWQPETDEERCELNCLLKAECEDFRSEFCAGGNDLSQAYEDCFDECGDFQLVECMTQFDGLTKVERCDGSEQCLDGRDEQGCPSSAFLACEGRYQERVPAAYKCDGEYDCIDGEDEEGCPAPGRFECKDGELIAADFECDGERDCADGSDESSCPVFACEDGSDTVPTSFVCDLEPDCADGSDEEQGCLKLTCSTSGADEFSALDAPLMSQQKSRKRR